MIGELASALGWPTERQADGTLINPATGDDMTVLDRQRSLGLTVLSVVLPESRLVEGAAARGTTTVIGKVADLKNLAAGEKSLLSRLPNLGSPKANWAQNSGVLRQEMRLGQPIRDATVDSAGQLINNTGFLRAERNLLQCYGWCYNPSSTMWTPPVGP